MTFTLIKLRDGRTVKATVEPPRPESKVEANLRLMSAAGDLAEALKLLARAYSDDPGTSDLDNEQPCNRLTLGDVRRAWAALSKAGVKW